MLTAFFLTDKFNGKIVNRSNYGATLPPKTGTMTPTCFRP